MTKRSRSKAKKVEAKASTNDKEEYWHDPETVEVIAVLANEVAREDNGEFKATDIVTYMGSDLGPDLPWSSIIRVMKENPSIFTRPHPRGRWMLVGWKATAPPTGPPKAQVKAQVKTEPKASTNGEEDYCKDPDAIEAVCILAGEAVDGDEFSASDIMRFLGVTENLGQAPWNTLGVIMKANPEIFTRSGPRARWTLVSKEEVMGKAESPAQKKAKKLVAKQAKALSKNGDDPPEDEPPPPVEEEPVEEETEPVEA